MLKILFFAVVMRPVLLLVLGVNIRHRERFPVTGPAVIVANHNSHLDTMALMAMLPLRQLPRVRPVAAADYFGGGGAMGWFARHVVGILPVGRGGTGGENPLAAAEAALDDGQILILFPEGSRGAPERMTRFKKGIAHLLKARTAIPVTPVLMHGFGKALPKGTWIFVPFNCDVFVGPALHSDGTVDGFMARLEGAFGALSAEARFPPWDAQADADAQALNPPPEPAA